LRWGRVPDFVPYVECVRPTGHLQIKGEAGRRRWYALWRDGEGRHQRVLGPAHAKPGTRRTARGAVVWQSGDGPKPGAEWLTPREARDALTAILAAAPTVVPRRTGVTFEQACVEWLRYIEHDRQRTASTVRDYRNTVRRYLLSGFGASTPVASITTEDIDDFREQMLGEGRLSRRTIQKILVLLHGILKRAKCKKWIKTNPAEDAERITVQRSGDFRVLSPEEVEALVRAASCEQDAAIYIVGAYTGLRLGELRGLRWADVDFGKRTVLVRRNIPQHGVEKVPKSGKVRSVPLAVRVFPLTGVKAYMGHADVQTTMIYVHHVPSARRRRQAVGGAACGDLGGGAHRRGDEP
jgi:integrase